LALLWRAQASGGRKKEGRKGESSLQVKRGAIYQLPNLPEIRRGKKETWRSVGACVWQAGERE